METLDKLFTDTLKDIYYAEKAILKALPKMAGKAASRPLAAAFKEHEAQTKRQVARLDKVFGLLGRKAQGKKCPAMDGLIAEGADIIKEAKDDTVRDAGMLAAAQAIEHYEISRYGTLIAWAEKLGMSDGAALLRETLAEEKATDAKLSTLAKSEINVAAEKGETANSTTAGRSKASSTGKRRT